MRKVRYTGTTRDVQLEACSAVLPSVVSNTSQDYALLKNLVATEGFAA
jgi:hypothetical protein